MKILETTEDMKRGKENGDDGSMGNEETLVRWGRRTASSQLQKDRQCQEQCGRGKKRNQQRWQQQGRERRNWKAVERKRKLVPAGKWIFHPCNFYLVYPFQLSSSCFVPLKPAHLNSKGSRGSFCNHLWSIFNFTTSWWGSSVVEYKDIRTFLVPLSPILYKFIVTLLWPHVHTLIEIKSYMHS